MVFLVRRQELEELKKAFAQHLEEGGTAVLPTFRGIRVLRGGWQVLKMVEAC